MLRMGMTLFYFVPKQPIQQLHLLYPGGGDLVLLFDRLAAWPPAAHFITGAISCSQGGPAPTFMVYLHPMSWMD